MGRIYKGQTERVVILLTPQELKDLTTIANALGYKVSAIGRELLIQYIKDNTNTAIVKLIDKQNELSGTKSKKYGVINDYHGDARILTNTQIKKIENEFKLKSWTGESKTEEQPTTPATDTEQDAFEPEPAEEQPQEMTPGTTEQGQPEPIQDNPSKVKVRYKANNHGHGRKWVIEELNIINLEPERFNDLEQEIIARSNVGDLPTAIETIRERLYIKKIPFTMDELITVIVKSKRIEYDRYDWVYKVIR